MEIDLKLNIPADYLKGVDTKNPTSVLQAVLSLLEDEDEDMTHVDQIGNTLKIR